MTHEEILKLWNDLTDYTYIYGMEDEVINIIKENIDLDLKRDEFGNYYTRVGDSRSLFVCHLDVVSKGKMKVTKIEFEKDGKDFVKSDGFTILGADDKTGVVILLNMIDNKIPGTYYFLIGEEVGTVGSGLIYKNNSSKLSVYDRCISFDRKWYGSIINRQMGEYCCSDEFVNALSKEFRKNKMKYKADSHGVWTDSALFMGTIPECTNLSVGYNKEHTYSEEQDITYMLRVCDASINIDWENLPTVRTPKSFDTEDLEFTENDLPIYKLRNMFDEIEDIIYTKTKSFSANANFFTPNKEMKFFKVSDLKGDTKFSLYLYTNGSIKIVKNNIILNFENISEFKSKVLVNDKFLTDLIDGIKENIITKFGKFPNN